jgi:hypothetical protein
MEQRTKLTGMRENSTGCRCNATPARTSPTNRLNFWRYRRRQAPRQSSSTGRRQRTRPETFANSHRWLYSCAGGNCIRIMLSVPTRSFRIKAAIVLAAVYALCVLAPSAAFAFSGNPLIAHCLIEDHATATVHDHAASGHDHGGNIHMHADGTAHQHHDDGQAPKSHSGGGKADIATCCGLFSVVAIAGEPDLVLGSSGHASILLPPPREVLSGRGPERINRPPISLLSL